MKTLLENLLEVEGITKKIIAYNPTVTSVWHEFIDVPMDELRAAGEHFNVKVEYVKFHKKMVLQLSWQIANSTVFAYSKEVKAIEHIVIETAYENI